MHQMETQTPDQMGQTAQADFSEAANATGPVNLQNERIETAANAVETNRRLLGSEHASSSHIDGSATHTQEGMYGESPSNDYARGAVIDRSLGQKGSFSGQVSGGSNSKMEKKNFELNQRYDELAKTQQRDTLPSSKMDRKTIGVNVQSVSNQFKVRIDQGSADSNNSQANLQHRLTDKPTFGNQVVQTHEKSTGAIFVNEIGNNVRVIAGSKEFNSMASSVRSFEVQPKYTQNPRVKIEAQTLNRDLGVSESGDLRSPSGISLKGAGSPVHNPGKRRIKEELQTATVQADQAAQLQSEEQLSPYLKGAKLKLSKHTSVRALRGVEDGSRMNKMQHQESSAANQMKRTQLHLKTVDTVKGRSQINEIQPFDNVLSGSQIQIQATPATQYIEMRKKQLAKLKPVQMKGNKMIDDSSPTTTLRHIPIPETISRDTPDTSDNVKVSPNYYQPADNVLVQDGRNVGSRNTQQKMRRSYRSRDKNQSSRHQSKLTNASKARDRNMRQCLSKDLIDVINQESEGYSSYEHNNERLQTKQTSPVKQNMASPRSDVKRGSAITFFDESENENDQNKYDEMKQTLAGFKRPYKVQDATINTNLLDDHSEGRGHLNHGHSSQSRLKNSTLQTKQLRSPSLKSIKDNLIEFHQNHGAQIQDSQKQLMQLFPELQTQVQLSSAQNPEYTSHIPKYDVLLDDKQIGRNAPASGIRIFEEHNSNNASIQPTGTRKTRLSGGKSLSPSPSNQSSNMMNNSAHGNSNPMLLQTATQHARSDAAQNQARHQGSLNYQMAPHQRSPMPVGGAQNKHLINDNAMLKTATRIVSGSDSNGTLNLDLASPLSNFGSKKHNHEASRNGYNMGVTLRDGKQQQRNMQTLSPKKVQPEWSLQMHAKSGPNATNQVGNNSNTTGNGFLSHKHAIGQKKLSLQLEKNRKLIKEQDFQQKQVHLDLTQKIGGRNARIVERKNTEVLVHDFFNSGSNSKINSNTMQKVMDIQENLNVTIHKEDQIKQLKVPIEDLESQNSASQIEHPHINSLNESIYQKKFNNKGERGNQADDNGQADAAMTVAIEDAVTLEQKESAMARYLDNAGQNEMQISAYSKQNAFNLTNNMMNLRQMQPKEASLFPMEAPPVKSTQRFNVTQFRKQMQLLDANSKFSASFLVSPTQQKTMSNMMQSPSTDLRVKINHRQQQRNGIQMVENHLITDLGFNKQTIADKIREVKEQNHYLSGNVTPSPRLSSQNPKTTNNFSPNNRSRSIDIRTKRSSNPFAMGGVAAARVLNNTQVSRALMNDVAKRFKNISDREAPANHISDRVYADAQNQSYYNNSYSFVGKEEIKKQALLENKKSRANLSQSVNASHRNSKAELERKVTNARNMYQQRKVSTLERPTQLEIGGERSPMLSLLPPLKTREISPKFSFTVGKKVKDQRVKRSPSPGKEKDMKQKRSSSMIKRNESDEGPTMNQVHYLPSTKIIISQSGDSPMPREFHEDTNGNQNMIAKHPVMIKATSSGATLPKPSEQKTEPPRSRLRTHEGPPESGNKSPNKEDDDIRLDSQTASYLQNEYRDVLLVNKEDAFISGHPGPLQSNPDDASLNEKLAEMANKVYRDVIVPLDQFREDDPVQYERRQLNIDGTWKDYRYRQNQNVQAGANPAFHFLEYAKSNFRNPLELIQATSPNNRVGQGNTTVGQTQQLANLDQLDTYATKKRAIRKNDPNRNKCRSKRAHHSQTYAVDEKFSLKVQKKPIQGLQHIKVEQTSGPDGIKLYSIRSSRRTQES